MPTNVNKITPHTDGKRRTMVMNKLTAVALCGRGANPEANVTFFKSQDKPKETQVEKQLVLTSSEDGHSHLLGLNEMVIGAFRGGESSYTDGHLHPFVINGDGTISIGEADGHTHTYAGNVEDLEKQGPDDETDEERRRRLARLRRGRNSRSTKTANSGGSQANPEDSNMPDNSNAVITEPELKILKTQLAVQTALASMNDAQKTHYGLLSKADQDSYLTMSLIDRNAAIEAAAKADPIEYTADDGTEYHKSQGTVVITMAKRLDTQDKELAKQIALTNHGALVKRAGEELTNLTGDQTAKVALLKSVDAIEDDEIRKSVSAILKACNTGAKLATTTLGSQTPTVVKEASDELDALCKTYATDNNVSESEAYSKVLDTKAGQALYNQANA